MRESADFVAIRTECLSPANTQPQGFVIIADK